MKPALFSVSYAGYWGQHRLGVVDFLEKAAALGYPAVEIVGKRPHLSPLDYPGDESLAQVREAAERLGVEVATIAGYNDFTSGRQAAEVPFVEMQIRYVADLSRIANSLGASIVRVFSGYFTDEANYQSDWTRCVTALRESAAVAADYGVVLGLQNHHDVGVSVNAYEELFADVDHPNMKAMFDPWSIALIGEDLYESARRLAPRMVQTTLADYVRLLRFRYRPELVNYDRCDPAAVRAVPLGEGFINLEAFFAGLKEGGFDGYVTYEMCSPLRGGGSEENLDHAATRSLERIRTLAQP
ncbi:MAG: sugar phosphate isomerase/epimerase [Planctomycetota bacterium]|nr:MAG: sugar phosphate isomerase/epimerase [Planctomycetota bacterium]REK32848.1 MAG: sugar phosphate isomerase/epimerase [Planctomycetota bacterium]